MPPRLPLLGRRESGVALIFVLAMLVMVVVVVMAVFSRAALHRQTGSASVSTLKTRLFSETAMGFLLEDLRQEIEAGSQPDPLSSSEVRIYRPTLVTPTGSTVPGAPSIVPQRVAAGQIPNILKISRSGAPFFSQGDGYASGGPLRASDVGTDERALNGRYFARDRWNRARLMTADEFADFTVPDWIYVDREGKTPTDLTAANLPQVSKSDAATGDFVVGRYAYVLYDVGGLVDINVAGNQLGAIENGRRDDFTRLHWTKLGVSLYPILPTSLTGGHPSRRETLRQPRAGMAFLTRSGLF